MDVMDHPHPIMRLLVSSTYTNLGNGSLIIPENECFCMAWLKSKGSHSEQVAANALQWSAFGFSVLLLVYYAYATWKSTCGWEEIYVCCVETAKVVIEFFHEFDEPSMLYLSNGNRVQWLRYAEWLLTCPVILIHLSNLTGLQDDYNKRTMRLLVSDIGTIVWGTTSAMSQSYVKVIFFVLGCIYGANTFFHAAKVYIEAYHTVPVGTCRNIVRAMAWLFFVSWGMFPILFLLGPEGFGHLSVYGSTIGHTIIDVMSKNCWGLLGHYLRLKIHQHILLYGDIRKVTKIKVAGQELEVETMMAEEDTETVKKPTGHYASRESFLVMRDTLKEKGYEVRASLENSAAVGALVTSPNTVPIPANGVAKTGMEMHTMSDGAGAITPGRVILAVPDISMVDFFREQFAQLPVPYEVIPSLGVDNTLQLVQQAANLGGVDFVLVHPEFLRDKTPLSLTLRLRSMGQRVAAFGWAPLGPVRDLIEGAGLDGWLEGPSFGSGVGLANLHQLVARMQQSRKMAALMAANMSMLSFGGVMGQTMGGMPNLTGNGMGLPATGNGMANAGALYGASMSGGVGAGLMPPPMTPSSRTFQTTGSGIGVPMGPAGSMTLMQQAASGTGMGSMPSYHMGTNPLFNAAPSPLSSQPGDVMGSAGLRTSGVGAAGMAPPAAMNPAAGGGAASEAEMLQQLMNEINRLKNELGEQH